jgi:hypothetical protein
MCNPLVYHHPHLGAHNLVVICHEAEIIDGVGRCRQLPCRVHTRTEQPIFDIGNYRGQIYYGQSQFYNRRASPEGLWREVRKQFKPGNEGLPVERWLMAASRCASPQEQQELVQATPTAMLSFTTREVYVDRPALAILALRGGTARFPDLPVAGNLHGKSPPAMGAADSGSHRGPVD